MTKYIVKNCPAIKPMITVDGKHGGKTMFDVCSEGKYTPCQDRTDCPIKQVIKKEWFEKIKKISGEKFPGEHVYVKRGVIRIELLLLVKPCSCR